MIDMENLIDEIDTYEGRLQDMQERIKELDIERNDAIQEFFYMREYRDYLMAKKRVSLETRPQVTMDD
jgi:predicted nuclease with TOPRIM domain